MFQYATGRALSLDREAELVLDTSWFKRRAIATTPRPYLLGQFPHLCGRLAGKHELRAAHVLAPNIGTSLSQFVKQRLDATAHYTGLTRVALEPTVPAKTTQIRQHPHLFLDGYWQDELYFQRWQEQICEAFTFPALASDYKRCIAEHIKTSPNAVALHVRRGDYVQGERQLGTAAPRYYQKALALIDDKLECSDSNAPTIFVFSDDSEWINQHFELGGRPFTAVRSQPDESPLDDMQLMALCSHHIIANSTFSWWGAWLAAPDGIVCAPDPWFAGTAVGSASPCPARWNRVVG